MTFSPSANGTRPIVPVPESAPPMPMSHHVLGRPSAVWTYRDAQGRVCFNVLRFDRIVDGSEAKTVRPMSCVETAEGRIEWRFQQAPAPRVLFNLPALVADSNAVVVIAEGEKAAEAAGRLMPGCVATTSSGGSNAAAQTDWSALRGRECILLPDHDEPGRKYAGAVGEILRDVGVASLRVLDIAQIGAIFWRDGQEMRRSVEEIPQGYDLADAEQEGWTSETLLTALETFPGILTEVISTVSPDLNDSAELPASDPGDDTEDNGNFVCTAEGVFKRTVSYDKRTKRRTEDLIRICGCLDVIGFARNKKSNEWGRMIVFTDPDGKKKQLVVSGADFAGNGTDVAKRLISEGLSLVPTRAVLEMLAEYILTSTPKKRFTFTKVPGWCGKTFALPGNSYGPDDIVCDLGEADHPYDVSGSFEEWQEIPRLALGNSRLIFSLSIAFAGPLLEPCGFESGGFILVGSSGDGKTTLISVAGSVWGGREGGDYCASWSGSDSGLEGIAVRSSGTLLALDEIGTVDPKLLGAVTYMTLNGRGKNRADVRGRLLSSAAWSCMLLATGEKTLSELIDDPLRGRRSTAGQKVRLVDVPADVPGASGVFEVLHGFPSSRAFSDHLRTLSKTHYGHAGRAFLEKLTADLDGAKAVVREIVEAFVAEACPPGSSRQVQRVATRFGLVAAAGELAAAYGVLPWPAGVAITAVERCFGDWLGRQGDPTLSIESKNDLEVVRRFVSAHGASRFEEIIDPSLRDREGVSEPRMVLNRAGYRRTINGALVYYVLPEIWKADICVARDPDKVARALFEAGHLTPGEVDSKTGKLRWSKKIRLPGHTLPVRCYVLSASILGEEDGAEEAVLGEEEDA